MRARCWLGLIVVVALGCGGRQYASVSGKVTLNGKPLANALVTFQPMAPDGALDAGMGSTGRTNDNGEYALRLSSGDNGARVGRHHVMVTLLAVKDRDPEDDTRVVRGGPPLLDTIPARYNSESTLTFEVPSGGSQAGNFDLTSP
jgi:glycine/D-amino acid oxidase-like deaminating enzyme